MASTNAATPAVYQVAYINKTASSQGVYGYMGFSAFNTYDVLECSKRCDAVIGRQSFNIYAERDPSVEPTESCPNPASEIVFKCVYYGGPVTAASAINDGQYRKDFHVVIADSNGYCNNSINTPAGYEAPVFLDRATINALKDCNRRDTHMDVKLFTTGAFSIDKCAAACTAQSDYSRKHPAKNGFFQRCQFFNTYVIYIDSTIVGKHCSLYNETWSSTYATNQGQWSGSNYFSIGYSYISSNSTGGIDKPTGCANPAGPK